MKTLGQIAWETWSTLRGHQGRTWDQVSPDIKNDWEDLAQAVLSAHHTGSQVGTQIVIQDDPSIIRGTGGSESGVRS